MTTVPFITGNPFLDANFSALASAATPGGSTGNVQYNNAGALGGKALPQFGYWSPLTNGNSATPALIFTLAGDTIDVWIGS